MPPGSGNLTVAAPATTASSSAEQGGAVLPRHRFMRPDRSSVDMGIPDRAERSQDRLARLPSIQRPTIRLTVRTLLARAFLVDRPPGCGDSNLGAPINFDTFR